jgi:hypothetical protein
MATAARVEIVGLNDLIADLRAAPGRSPAEIRRVHREAASRVADSARANAAGMGSVQAKAAPSIRGAAEQRYAVIRIGGQPYAAGAYLGAKRYRQFPAYRGAGDPTQLYAVGPGITEELPWMLDLYAKRLGDLIAK